VTRCVGEIPHSTNIRAIGNIYFDETSRGQKVEMTSDRLTHCLSVFPCAPLVLN
jgi:hypothetical protein